MTFRAFILLLLCGLFLYSCKPKTDVEKTKNRFSFIQVKGIRFYEVKRRFSNDLSFHKSGFQLEPNWILEFISNDSVSVWSPERYQWFRFPVTFDHGSVYNFAGEYFRIKHVSKDSILMQRLEVKSLAVVAGEMSDVNLTFYSKDYIFNKLHTNPEKLQQPTLRDSIFVKQMVARSNRNPLNIDSAFGARVPVQFLPLSKVVSVTKKKTTNVPTEVSNAKNYLYPEYTIKINRAYKDFAHMCSAIVDANGNIKTVQVQGVLPEYLDNQRKVIDGILEVYVHNLFKVIPGNTLGLAHSSEIQLYLVGKKEK